MDQEYYLEIPENINENFISETKNCLMHILNRLNSKFVNTTDVDDVVEFSGERGKRLYDCLNLSFCNNFNFLGYVSSENDLNEIRIRKNYDAKHIEELKNLTKTFSDGRMAGMKIRTAKTLNEFVITIHLDNYIKSDKEQNTFVNQTNQNS